MQPPGTDPLLDLIRFSVRHAQPGLDGDALDEACLRVANEIVGAVRTIVAKPSGVDMTWAFRFAMRISRYAEDQIKVFLPGAKLTRADLLGADLAEAKLTGVNLAGVNLSMLNLAGANLAGANLTGANLTRANLTGANLTRANLTGANLTRANLTRANLTRANLAGANLAGANLAGANPFRSRLTGVRWSEGTRWPDPEFAARMTAASDEVDQGILVVRSTGHGGKSTAESSSPVPTR